MRFEQLESRNLLAVDSLSLGDSIYFHPDVDGDNLPELVSFDWGLGTADLVAFSTDQIVQSATVENMPLDCDEFGDCFFRDAISKEPADFDGDAIKDVIVSTGSIGEIIFLSAARPTETDRSLRTVSIPGLFISASTTGSRSVVMRHYNNIATAAAGAEDHWYGYVDGELKPGFQNADGEIFDPNNDGIEDRIAMYGFHDWRIVFSRPQEPFSSNYGEGRITLGDSPELDRFANEPGMIAAWVKLPDANEWNSIVRTLCADEASFMCEQFGPSTGIELQINEGQVFGTVTGYRNNVFGPRAITSGKWTHIAMTWDNQGNNVIFVNGEAGEASTHGDGMKNSPKRWALGTDPLDLQAEDEPEGRAIRGEMSELIFASGEIFDVTSVMEDTLPFNPADVDQSGQVDFADFLVISANFGANVGDEGRHAGDLDGDTKVTFEDFLILSREFGKRTN